MANYKKKIDVSNIDRLVKQAEKHSLTNDELLKLCRHKAKIMTYPELAKYKHVDDILKPHGALIILYETRFHYGHWVCLIKHKKNKLEFFDSYGLMPDDELEFVPKHFRKANNMDYPHLTYLLYTSNYQIEYNHTKLQSKLEDVNTCGRWVGMRINMRSYSLPKFVEFFTKDNCKSPDWLVTAISLYL